MKLTFASLRSDSVTLYYDSTSVQYVEWKVKQKDETIVKEKKQSRGSPKERMSTEKCERETVELWVPPSSDPSIVYIGAGRYPQTDRRTFTSENYEQSSDRGIRV